MELDCFNFQKSAKDGRYSYCKECCKIWRRMNAVMLREAKREYKKRNKGKTSFNTAKRRALKKKALPKWLTKDQLELMRMMYKLARYMTEVTNIQHEVDHIEPLQGKNSCGLHVPWNLRVVPWYENANKGNNI